jgi:MoxR-like ATPase
MADWHIFRGNREPHDGIRLLPDPPGWRAFSGAPIERDLPPEPTAARRMGSRPGVIQVTGDDLDIINAALYLRRPLLVTGKAGVGKSTLAYALTEELKLGPVLRWSITSSTTLKSGLYHYDAIARFQASRPGEETPDIGHYIRLGPLATALLPTLRPRVLLIDEIDKSDLDLPNDLLHVFEEGEFEIPELVRVAETQGEVMVRADDGADVVPVRGGRVRCNAFPVVVMTSNAEREFPPAFLRRCLRLDIRDPDEERLASIVEAHLELDGPEAREKVRRLVQDFTSDRKRGDLSIDQLMNAVFLTQAGIEATAPGNERLREALFRHLRLAVA